jgi:hypothetical protein
MTYLELYIRIIQSRGGTPRGLYHGRILYESCSNRPMATSSKRTGNLSSANSSRITKKSAKNLKIYYFSDFFAPFCAENGDGKRPSQEHLKHPKTQQRFLVELRTIHFCL